MTMEQEKTTVKLGLLKELFPKGTGGYALVKWQPDGDSAIREFRFYGTLPNGLTAGQRISVTLAKGKPMDKAPGKFFWDAMKIEPAPAGAPQSAQDGPSKAQESPGIQYKADPATRASNEAIELLKAAQQATEWLLQGTERKELAVLAGEYVRWVQLFQRDLQVHPKEEG